jgi:hypothetical protein
MIQGLVLLLRREGTKEKDEKVVPKKVVPAVKPERRKGVLLRNQPRIPLRNQAMRKIQKKNRITGAVERAAVSKLLRKTVTPIHTPMVRTK